MLLIELFDTGGEMMQRMRQAALDILTPLMGQDVPFVTVNFMIDALRNKDMGIAIDRGLVMKLLNPEEVKAISKIDGDRIYFQGEEGAEHETSDPEKDQKKVMDTAQKQAAKEVQT